jgi:HrpA-like RNA helicase
VDDLLVWLGQNIGFLVPEVQGIFKDPRFLASLGRSKSNVAVVQPATQLIPAPIATPATRAPAAAIVPTPIAAAIVPTRERKQTTQQELPKTTGVPPAQAATAAKEKAVVPAAKEGSEKVQVEQRHTEAPKRNGHERPPESEEQSKRRLAIQAQRSEEARSGANIRLRTEWAKQQQTGPYQVMLKARKKLPSLNMQKEICDSIAAHQVTVISGATGCGKSTQVPQFVLDDLLENGHGGSAHIVCTQPRRLAAIGVAERVANERAEKIGGMVGYQIRLEQCRSKDTRLLFCTTGILLRTLEGDPDLIENSLCPVSHVIVDEV